LGVDVAPRRPQLSLASQMEVDVPPTTTSRRSKLALASQGGVDVSPSYPVAKRMVTSDTQTDPPTTISVVPPRPSWTFKVPRASVARERVGQRPLGLVRQRQQQRRDQLALTYHPSPKKKTPTKKRVRKAPVKFSPEMIRRVNKRKGESKAAFNARRQLYFDDPIASSSAQQPAPSSTAAVQSSGVYDNPVPSTSAGVQPRSVQRRRRPLGLARQRPQYSQVAPTHQPAATTAAAASSTPRWMPSKTVKRTATAAHMDTPLARPRHAPKKGRPNKGDKRPLPTTFASPQQRKRGKKE
jgi:hypothetical protein